MQLPASNKSRQANRSEKARMQWLKDRGICSACKNPAPVVNHHCAGAAEKIKFEGETIQIGHAFVISLCQPCDSLVTNGSRRRLVEAFGPQSTLWLWQEAENPNPGPAQMVRAIAHWGEKYEPRGESANG